MKRRTVRTGHGTHDINDPRRDGETVTQFLERQQKRVSQITSEQRKAPVERTEGTPSPEEAIANFERANLDDDLTPEMLCQVQALHKTGDVGHFQIALDAAMETQEVRDKEAKLRAEVTAAQQRVEQMEQERERGDNA